MIHVSNFRKIKRVKDIIYTFKKIHDKLDAKLLLVGDGPETSTAFQLVKELGLKDHVLFLGKQKKVSDLLSISDLKLLLSEQESFGLVLLEAMCCEVPCIGTNIGGIPEVIKHNETGFLVEVGDVDRAAEYAINVLKNDNLLKTLSNNALLYAKSEFHSEKIVQEYISLYKEVLN